MKNFYFYINLVVITCVIAGSFSCGTLDEPLPQQKFVENTDYTKSEDMVKYIEGAYYQFNDIEWETFPLISVRGDDVNAKGDQVPLWDTEDFRYDRSFWMYNSAWLNLYSDIIAFHAIREELEKFKKFAPDPAVPDQYIAEIKVLSAYELLQLSRVWGAVLIPTSSQTDELLTKQLSSTEEVWQYISDQMDEAIPMLPAKRPNERTDVPGGATKFTALAVKAMANLELKNYTAVASATEQIISSNKFTLYSDYYELFKKPGKLADENLLEFQYSDFGLGSGENKSYLYAFFGPNNWTPAASGAGAGWGFWEPTLKYIKFMLDRGETTRLETSVLFTNQGIDSLKADPKYTNTLPAFVTNTSRDGDIFGVTDGTTNPRSIFISGKHYLPSIQLTSGRSDYGTSKNLICIRYSEILLMHAEALTSGASSSVMSADEAVNTVRARASMGNLSGVTIDDVLDEKFAEFAMEWGIRFYDLVRHNKTSELNNKDGVYTDDVRFLPYPLQQIDILPQLNVN